MKHEVAYSISLITTVLLGISIGILGVSVFVFDVSIFSEAPIYAGVFLLVGVIFVVITRKEVSAMESFLKKADE